MRIKLIYAAVISILMFSACSGNIKNDNKADGQLSTEVVDNAAANSNEEINSNNNNQMAKVINLTRAEFLEKVANFEKNPEKWEYLGDKPCIIDFYADWCGPCKMVAPILDELAVEYADIYIYKVDTEVEQQLSAEFGIRSIPSMLFVPMKDQPQMAQGALPKDALKQAISEVLLNN